MPWHWDMAIIPAHLAPTLTLVAASQAARGATQSMPPPRSGGSIPPTPTAAATSATASASATAAFSLTPVSSPSRGFPTTPLHLAAVSPRVGLAMYILRRYPEAAAVWFKRPALPSPPPLSMRPVSGISLPASAAAAAGGQHAVRQQPSGAVQGNLSSDLLPSCNAGNDDGTDAAAGPMPAISRISISGDTSDDGPDEADARDAVAPPAEQRQNAARTRGATGTSSAADGSGGGSGDDDREGSSESVTGSGSSSSSDEQQQQRPESNELRSPAELAAALGHGALNVMARAVMMQQQAQRNTGP